MTKQLSHIDEAGKASMVDVSDKSTSVRTARASGKVLFLRMFLTNLQRMISLEKKEVSFKRQLSQESKPLKKRLN